MRHRRIHHRILLEPPSVLDKPELPDKSSKSRLIFGRQDGIDVRLLPLRSSDERQAKQQISSGRSPDRLLLSARQERRGKSSPKCERPLTSTGTSWKHTCLLTEGKAVNLARPVICLAALFHPQPVAVGTIGQPVIASRPLLPSR
jgi:hypothetical protein